MSIPINIDDPTVLRRTLEELDSKLLNIEGEITKVPTILATATLAEVIEHLNTVSERLNTVVTALNSSLR